MDIRKSLKVALAIRDIKQKDLAERIGVRPQQVSNWIRLNKIGQGNLEAVCSALELPVSEFIALGEE